MSQPSPSQPTAGLTEETAPARNPAVQRCCEARDRSLEESRICKVDESRARRLGEQAYRNALPDLAGYENIRDFIACISHGLLTGDISPINSPSFLYAAQVAISALRLEPKEKKNSLPCPPGG